VSQFNNKHSTRVLVTSAKTRQRFKGFSSIYRHALDCYSTLKEMYNISSWTRIGTPFKF